MKAVILFKRFRLGATGEQLKFWLFVLHLHNFIRLSLNSKT